MSYPPQLKEIQTFNIECLHFHPKCRSKMAWKTVSALYTLNGCAFTLNAVQNGDCSKLNACVFILT